MSTIDHLRVFVLAGCAALVSVNCTDEVEKQTPKSGAAQRDSGSRDDEHEGPGEEERKKKWSGLSYAAQTTVQLTPSASLATSGFDSERVWGGTDDWEPAVAADPGAPYVYQMTTRYGGNQPDVVFRRSVDGGATWEADQVLASNAADPMIEVADDGTIYAMAIVGGGFKLKMTRSFDHGVTWTSLEDILGPGQPNWGDRPVLVVSPDGQDVYVGFNQGDSYVVSSHDGAESFGTPGTDQRQRTNLVSLRRRRRPHWRRLLRGGRLRRGLPRTDDHQRLAIDRRRRELVDDRRRHLGRGATPATTPTAATSASWDPRSALRST